MKFESPKLKLSIIFFYACQINQTLIPFKTKKMFLLLPSYLLVCLARISFFLYNFFLFFLRKRNQPRINKHKENAKKNPTKVYSSGKMKTSSLHFVCKYTQNKIEYSLSPLSLIKEKVVCRGEWMNERTCNEKVKQKKLFYLICSVSILSCHFISLLTRLDSKRKRTI